mmetsp:Transcript_68837/g.224257  ORF Transcript_68837/g.224257 Transcript_68837/m.224257 type:complete len:535 (+) Transcript_68837:150-1754(+)
MDLLVWPRAKVLLYLVEAAHVKAVVGRDRIQRNKDTLRELRCLQEILADLHAGRVGSRAGSRDAAEAAVDCWSVLRTAATARGQNPEDLVEVSPAVRRFLLTRCPNPAAANGACSLPWTAGVGCGSEVALTSTRAPSVCSAVGLSAAPQEADTQSIASTSAFGDGARSEAASVEPAHAPPARTKDKRMNRRQLEELAVSMRGQLDEEYTSLMASIEEVQALMEAEVSGTGLLPSRAELEAFCSSAASALASVPPAEKIAAERTDALEVATFADDLETEDAFSKSAVSSPSSSSSSGRGSSGVSRGAAACTSGRGGDGSARWMKSFSTSLQGHLEAEDEADGEAAADGSSAGAQAECCPGVFFGLGDKEEQSPRQRQNLRILPEEDEEVQADTDGASARHRSEAAQRAPSAEGADAGRPRWSDMCSDDSEDSLSRPRAAKAASAAGATIARATDEGASAHGECCRCRRSRGRSAFSRRSWRQARGLGAAAGVSSAAACIDCSGSAGGPGRPAGVRPASSAAVASIGSTRGVRSRS